MKNNKVIQGVLLGFFLGMSVMAFLSGRIVVAIIESLLTIIQAILFENS